MNLFRRLFGQKSGEGLVVTSPSTPQVYLDTPCPNCGKKNVYLEKNGRPWCSFCGTWGEKDNPTPTTAFRPRVTEKETEEQAVEAVRSVVVDPNGGLESQEKALNGLAEHVINGISPSVKREAFGSMILQLPKSSRTVLGISTYPKVVEAMAHWIVNAPRDRDLMLTNVNLLPDRFFWVLTNTEGAEKLISSLSAVAEDNTRQEKERNGATILLCRMNDKRCGDVLARLTKDKSTYVASNAKRGLTQLKQNQ